MVWQLLVILRVVVVRLLLLIHLQQTAEAEAVRIREMVVMELLEAEDRRGRALIALRSSPGRQARRAQQGQPMMKRPWPYSTAWPFWTRISRTVPETSASISLSSFIASMMHKVSPGLIVWPTSTKALASGPGER